MRRSLAPIIYDFRRSFFRVSTLVLLFVFIVAGIGLSYLSYTMIYGSVPTIRTMGVIIIGDHNATVYGVAYDLAGREISGATITLLNKTGRTITEEKVGGFYHFSFKTRDHMEIAGVKIMYNGRETEERVMTIGFHGNNTILYYAPFNSAFTIENGDVMAAPGTNPQVFAVISLILLDKARGDAVLQILSINTSSTSLKPCYELLLGYAKYNTTVMSTGIVTSYTTRLSNCTYYETLRIHSILFRQEIKLDTRMDALVLRYDRTNMTLTIDYSALQPARSFMIGSMLSSGALTIFVNFFPIAFLYLAYVLMSKPRSSGALEFILARPVTKWDLYLTRYASGILVALASSAVFVVTLNLSSALIWGVLLGAQPSITMFLAVLVSLTAWYSFCYMLASSIRSSSRYLALSIVFYLLFMMFWSLIVFLVGMYSGAIAGSESFTELSYRLSMLNPIKVGDLIIYYIREFFGLVKPIHWINPGIVAVASLAWIVVPFIIGYLLFRRD